MVAEYLQSVCTWDVHQCSSSCGHSRNNNNPPTLPAPLLILPPQVPILHRLIDLMTYDEILEPENRLELRRVARGHSTLL